ncbi:hypothetical protein L1987_45887 [Smallanthus sonchifolius]|uniref:Uncharacterized protein n=1 Tax=Smallanthus sonchifolius TaxID=185202 RepID=A0ACB9FXM9_9ASTR|nr:hypothetical protein L1987_45887 [Smallanthus sonchifolius]
MVTGTPCNITNLFCKLLVSRKVIFGSHKTPLTCSWICSTLHSTTPHSTTPRNTTPRNTIPRSTTPRHLNMYYSLHQSVNYSEHIYVLAEDTSMRMGHLETIVQRIDRDARPRQGKAVVDFNHTPWTQQQSGNFMSMNEVHGATIIPETEIVHSCRRLLGVRGRVQMCSTFLKLLTGDHTSRKD